MLVKSWRCKRNWEETEPGQLTQTNQRDAPYLCVVVHSNKNGVNEDIGTDGIYFSKRSLDVISPACLAVMKILPANGKQQVNSLLCLHSFCFTWLIVFVSAQKFSHFHLSDFLPYHIYENEQVASRCLQLVAAKC